MELGNFLGKLKGKEKEEPKRFLALILTDEVVQAAVWSIVSEVTEIIAIGTPVEWDGDTGTTGELVTAVDATISSAVEGLSADPGEVILGIPHSWTDKNGILGVKREFIKKISQELELHTLGFVVMTDSVLSYLKMQEGTPTTSILIQVSRDELTLVLVRLGRIEAIETIGRSDDVVQDVTEGIARFKASDNLPSRIILFNSMHDLSEIIQNLLSVDWPSQFNFLHIPKIEALPKDIAIRALSVAGGSEVAKSLGFTVSDTIVSPPDIQEAEELEFDDSDNLLAEQPADSPISLPQDSELLSAEEIGFTQVSPEPIVIEATKAKRSIVIPKFKLPKIALPRLSFSGIKSHWWILGGSLVALSVLIFWFIWMLPTAKISVSVLPKTLEQDVELTLSTTASSIDFTKKIVPANIESLSQSGEKSIETTGTKIVGESATGDVTIYNRTSAPKSFPKGTTLTAKTLKFTLDKDVLVASKSAGADYVDVPGKATVSVTATAIGTDSNLSSDQEFSVQSFGKDSYVGKNDSSFTGGTSQEIQVVDKVDQDTLIKDLTAELLTQITDSLSSSSNPGSGSYLLPGSSVSNSAAFSAKIGEKATTLTLSLTLQATVLRYKTEDVTNLVNSAIDQAVPTGYIRANLPSSVELSASSVEGAGETVSGKAKVKVALLPVVDKLALVASVKGKKTPAIEGIFRGAIPGYQSAVIEILPSWMPAKLKLVPQNPKNISIFITATPL